MFGLWHRRPARDSACPPRIGRADGARNNQWAGFPGAAPTLPASPQVGIARAFGPENLVSAPTARSIPAWGGVGSADAAPGKRNAKAARAEGPIHARGPDAGPRRSVAQVTGNRFGRVPWARRPCHSGADASPPRCASRQTFFLGFSRRVPPWSRGMGVSPRALKCRWRQNGSRRSKRLLSSFMLERGEEQKERSFPVRSVLRSRTCAPGRTRKYFRARGQSVQVFPSGQ